MPVKIAKKIIKDEAQGIVEKTVYLHSQFKEHTSTAIIAAFSFVIALAWKDLTLKVINENLTPRILESYPYLSELITAVFVTIIAIVGITLVSKWAKK